MQTKSIVEDKVWGKVTHIFQSSQAAVSCLDIVENFQCSCHKHAERVNQFFVLEGSVIIEEWENGLDNPFSSRILTPGSSHFVPSQVWHRFKVIESGKMVEVYWPDRGGLVSFDDIERLDEGGEIWKSSKESVT